MRYSVSLFKILQNIEPHVREALIALLEEIERHQEEFVTKSELNELKKIVQELAEAQKRTEERLNELAEAQKQTEKELCKLVKEHRKTRENLGGLQHTVGYVL